MKRRTLVTTAVLVVGLLVVFGPRIWSPRSAVEKAAQQKSSRYTCPMHPAYVSDHPGECPICGMRLVTVGAGAKGSQSGGAVPQDAPNIVSLSADKQQLMGVRTELVERAPATRLTLRVPGRIAVDEQRLYRITAAVDGWIRQLENNPAGSFVRKDHVLATYYTQNLIGAAQSYVFALQSTAQAQGGPALIGAQRGPTALGLQVAVDSLRALGMSELQIKDVERTHSVANQVAVYAPIDGYVIARGILPEQRFDKGTEMYRIADIGHLWVMAEVFEKDSQFLKPGTRATVLYQGRRLEARMSDALPQFDPETRTLKTRFELDNPGRILRPDMFVDVEIQPEVPPAITVAADAVFDSGLRRTVFVDKGNGYFEARRVETGWRSGGRVEIVKGLMEGERVVASGNFLLDSESRMKAASLGIFNPETDPVCGMEVDRDKAQSTRHSVDYKGTTYYFCSDDCKHKFEQAPERYTEHAEGVLAPKAAAAASAVAKTAANQPTTTKDPVCGMEVDPKEAAAAHRTIDRSGTRYYFCSDECKQKFEKAPAQYLGTRR